MPLSLAVGDLAPDFSLVDPQTAQVVSRASLAGTNCLILFLRGTWCPFCQKQLVQLAAQYEQLQSAKIQVIAVSCQSSSALQSYLANNPLPFPLLPDTSRAVAKAFGTHYWLRWEGINLSHPALFILDSEGRVLFRYVGKRMDDLPLGALIEKFLEFLG